MSQRHLRRTCRSRARTAGGRGHRYRASTRPMAGTRDRQPAMSSIPGPRLIRLALIVAAIFVVATVAGVGKTVAIVAALILMIMLHEFGHFITAKRAGMKVTEYLPRLRAPPLVDPKGRDRVRRQGPALRRLREDHRDDQPRGGGSRRRGPHLPPEAVPEPPLGRPGRLDDALPHGPGAALRPVLRGRRPGDPSNQVGSLYRP